MPPLKEGIQLNQVAPKLHRANRKPLYLAISACAVIVALLIWAWIIKSSMRTETHGKAATPTQTAAPATSAWKTLDQQWAEKSNGAAASSATELTTSNGQHRQQQPSRVLSPLGSVAQPASPHQHPISLNPATPTLSPGQQAMLDVQQEEQAAMESPMVPQGQAHAPQTGPTDDSRFAASQNVVPATGSPGIQAENMTYRLPGEATHDSGEEYLSQNLQSSKKTFAGVDRETAQPILGDGTPDTPYVIKAGWDIPAILEQAANSDLPGDLRARVRENVYDTASGRYLLIPQNSILVGRYNSEVAYAQNRVQVNWDRLQRPGNEPTIYLQSMNGLDADGSAGLGGHVNNHYTRLIGFALLSSVFAAGIEISQNRNQSALTYPSNVEIVGQAVGQQLGEFGRKVTEKNLNRPPTISVLAGTRFTVRVDRDIVFVQPYAVR